MQVPIESILVKDRVRRDLGDLEPLMSSLRRFGQMNPVIVTRDSELIAGHRRLESARRLGWDTIDAVSLDRVDEVRKLEMELEENVHRKDLSPEELLDGYTRLEKLKHPSFWTRIKRFLRRVFDRLFRRGRDKGRELSGEGNPVAQRSADQMESSSHANDEAAATEKQESERGRKWGSSPVAVASDPDDFRVATAGDSAHGKDENPREPYGV